MLCWLHQWAGGSSARLVTLKKLQLFLVDSSSALPVNQKGRSWIILTSVSHYTHTHTKLRNNFKGLLYVVWRVHWSEALLHIYNTSLNKEHFQSPKQLVPYVHCTTYNTHTYMYVTHINDVYIYRVYDNTAVHRPWYYCFCKL